MKTFFRILIFILLFNYTLVDAYSSDISVKDINNMSDGIFEQIKPKFKNNKLKEINSTIIIPRDYKEDEIIITPKVFYSMGEFNSFKEKYNININIKIINNSSYNYKYKDNSLVIQTDDITRYGILDNFDFYYKLKGFDGRKIPVSYSLKFSENYAIKGLYKDKVKLSKLDSLLNKNGGINNYYLDFYNKKYNTSFKNLSEFNIEMLDDMFSGKILDKYINSKELIVIGYDYFYNRDLKFDDIPIGDYMRESKNLNNFNIYSKKSYKFNNMKLSASKFYYFPVDIYMEFRLIKF